LTEKKQTIMKIKTALDSNILVYLYDDDNEHKRNICELLIVDKPTISSQVISEFLNVTKRLLKLPKIEILEKASKLFSKCEITPMNQETLEKALFLINRYDFQLFDSLIVASSLQAGCTILYSEDMQHNLLVENQLRILNPFLI
jgi:predicted nucleic acid-binding protein